MNHPLRCRCGKFQGQVSRSRRATRAVCYCKDCQAYARFLGTPGVVDQDGGTQVVISLPRHVRFTAGVEVLACLSLGERGLLRWYASCCNTPIANTPRSPKVPYLGLIHSCLERGSSSIESTFGRLRIAVNTESARRKVRSTPVASTMGVLGFIMAAFGDRLGGGYKHNPFFTADTRIPVRRPRVLSSAERNQALLIRE